MSGSDKHLGGAFSQMVLELQANANFQKKNAPAPRPPPENTTSSTSPTLQTGAVPPVLRDKSSDAIKMMMAKSVSPGQGNSNQTPSDPTAPPSKPAPNSTATPTSAAAKTRAYGFTGSGGTQPVMKRTTTPPSVQESQPSGNPANPVPSTQPTPAQQAPSPLVKTMSKESIPPTLKLGSPKQDSSDPKKEEPLQQSARKNSFGQARSMTVLNISKPVIVRSGSEEVMGSTGSQRPYSAVLPRISENRLDSLDSDLMGKLSLLPIEKFSTAQKKDEAPGFVLSDRDTWTSEALKAHPEVMEVMERIRPLNRAVSFGRLYTEAKTPAREEFLVGKESLLQLVLQHLQYEGLRTSRKILEEESATKYVDYQLSESRLVSLLRLAIKDTERIWELALDERCKDAQQLLEEHLCDMGILEEMNREGEDVNIWDEPEEGNLIFTEDKEEKQEVDGFRAAPPKLEDKVRPIKAASLNKLIVMLTPGTAHDMEYVKTFLLTYQSFTTPEKLLQKLVQRYHVPQKEGSSKDDWRKISLPIQLRVVNVMRAWIKDHWSDFNDKLIVNLKAFIDNTLRLDGNQQLVQTLSSALNSKLRPEEDEEAKKGLKIFNEIPPEPKVPKSIFSPQLDLLDVDEEEIARQMTLIDFEIYSSIKPSELLNQSWNKPKLKHRSPNVLRCSARFNEVSGWVTVSILKVERIRDRARLMAKFIKIAEYLRKSLNNFNSALAILAGLNNGATGRLKFTREEMPKAIQQTLQELQATLSSNHYKEYRRCLSKANPPCIPYLGVYLTDLTFIEEGNPDLFHGLINYAKRKLVYNVIAQVKQYQQSSYNLQPVYQIACHLWKLNKGVRMEEDEQFRLSLLREPRGKDRAELL